MIIIIIIIIIFKIINLLPHDSEFVCSLSTPWLQDIKHYITEKSLQ